MKQPQLTPDAQVSAAAREAGDSLEIELTEGMRLVFPAHHWIGPRELLALAWACSAMLDGKPVRCVGLLPGLVLQVRTRLGLAELAEHAEAALNDAMVQLGAWVDCLEAAPLLWLAMPNTHAVVTSAEITQLLPAALLIERQYGWGLCRGMRA